MARRSRPGLQQPHLNWRRQLLGYSPVLAVAFIDLLQGDYVGAIFVILGMIVGGVIIALVGRMAWTQGYWNARGEMWASLKEAQRRGIGPDEWVKSQMERDIQNLS